MKAYISRKVPFYLLAADEVNDSIGFDAYPVDVSANALAYAQRARKITKVMEEAFANNSAPEEAAQQEADLFEDSTINGNK